MKNWSKWTAIAVVLSGLAAPIGAQEVTVIGSQEETISMLKADKWWAQKKRGQQLKVPYKMLAAIAERWQKHAPKLPEQQRQKLGDHRIASFDWPFDSVRGYYLNLSSHPAYKDFRRIRAEVKASGKPLSSLALAEGLKSYSERCQAYVDTLKGSIRTNSLDIADNAVFRDEPMSFILGAADQAAAAELRKDIEAMRKSGELAMIIERMRLE